MKNYRLFYCTILAIAMTFIFAPVLTAVKAQTRPQGAAKTANKSNSIPQNWIYVYDQKKGFGFYVPKDTTGGMETHDGVDVTVLKTPDPSGIDIFVLAFKDKTLTKEDLLDTALEFLTALGQTVTPEPLKAESDNYALADATTVLSDGRKGRLRVLVGTDVTDNYIMIIGAEPKTFAANEKTIDAIWGSFEMWSGR